MYVLRTDYQPGRFINRPPVYKPVNRFINRPTRLPISSTRTAGVTGKSVPQDFVSPTDCESYRISGPPSVVVFFCLPG